jgi:hypothetical protein
MRYLKRYNESRDLDLVEFRTILEFCRDQLALLYDYGFYVNLDYIPYNEVYSISIQKEDRINYYFTYSDVKDEFVTFYEVLKNRYELVSIYNEDNENSGFAELVCVSGEVSLTEEQIYDQDYDCKDIINIYINIKVK